MGGISKDTVDPVGAPQANAPNPTPTPSHAEASEIQMGLRPSASVKVLLSWATWHLPSPANHRSPGEALSPSALRQRSSWKPHQQPGSADSGISGGPGHSETRPEPSSFLSHGAPAWVCQVHQIPPPVTLSPSCHTCTRCGAAW